MFKAFGAIFNTIFTFAVAADKLAKATDHICSIAEDESSALREQMQLERRAKINKLKADLKEAA